VLGAFEITPGIATVIGALAAIMGGFLAALYTSRRTRRLALELRAIERQDEGLRMLAPLVNEIIGRIGMWREQSATRPEEPFAQAAAEAAEYQGKLRLLAEQELSWRLRDDSVLDAVKVLRELLRDMGANNVTNVSEVTAAEYAAIELNDRIKRILGMKKRSS
jgi:hypothetical protein